MFRERLHRHRSLQVRNYGLGLFQTRNTVFQMDPRFARAPTPFLRVHQPRWGGRLDWYIPALDRFGDDRGRGPRNEANKGSTTPRVRNLGDENGKNTTVERDKPNSRQHERVRDTLGFENLRSGFRVITGGRTNKNLKCNCRGTGRGAHLS